MQPRGHDEVAFLRQVGDIREDSLAFRRDTDAVIRQPVVRCCEDQHRPRKVRRAKSARHDADGQIVEFRFALRRDYRDARACFHQPSRFSQRDFARADHQDGAILQVEKNGIVLQIST